MGAKENYAPLSCLLMKAIIESTPQLTHKKNFEPCDELRFGGSDENRVVSYFNSLPESDLIDSKLLVETGLTEKQALRILERRDLSVKLYFECTSKELFAYALNGDDVHEFVIARLVAQLVQFGIQDGNRLIVCHGTRNYGGRMINADQCLVLRPNAQTTLQPALRDKLVIQVGVSESVASLHSHAAHLFASNTGVQVYLFIKIWKQRVDSTRAACLALYRRAHAYPVELMSFGDASPTHHFRQFFSNLFPNVQVPEIRNLQMIPTNENEDLFSLTIPGDWILPGANPALADLRIEFSQIVDLVRFL